MENSPSKPDKDREESTKPNSRKKNRSAGRLGGFAIEPAARQNPDTPAKENIWDKLTLTKRSGGETTDTIPLASLLDEAERKRSPELENLDEADERLASLSGEEEQIVSRKIIGAKSAKNPSLLDSSSEIGESFEITADEAVKSFHNRVFNGKQSVEQAFEETVNEVEAQLHPPEVENVVSSVEQPDEARSTIPQSNTEPTKSVDSPLHETNDLPAVNNDFEKQTTEFTSDNSEIDATDDQLGEAVGRDALPHTETIDTAKESGPNGPSSPPTPPVSPRSFSPNFYQPPAAQPARSVEKEYVPYYNDGDVLSAALIGGIVGYLVGRRRGRIKTEKKLKPIQKKLEKQVKTLEADITTKEYSIRKLVHDRTLGKQRMNRLENANRRNDKRIETLEAAKLRIGKSAEKTPKRIGQVLVTAQEVPRARMTVERSVPRSMPRKLETIKSEPMVGKRVETMTRADLLEMSNKINVENTTLRQVYETHLITEQGLRRLASEHVRGGDVQKVLRDEILQHEIDFERDPMLRDKMRRSAAGTATGSDALRQKIASADIANDDQTREELAVLKARQTHQETQRVKQQSRRKVMDASIVVAIATLFGLVILLIVRGY